MREWELRQRNDAPRHIFFGAYGYPKTDVILFGTPRTCGARKKIEKRATLKQKMAIPATRRSELNPSLRLGLYWNSGIFGKKDLGTKWYCISLLPFLLLPAVLFEQNQIRPLDILMAG